MPGLREYCCSLPGIRFRGLRTRIYIVSLTSRIRARIQGGNRR